MSNDGTFELDFSDLLRGLDLTEVKTQAAVKQGVHDSMGDLKRISVNIAPIDEADLRRSAHYRVTTKPTEVVGELTFSVTNTSEGYGRFNYAYWTHEINDNLGPKSQAAPGTDGYAVGNKYLERPLKGEAEKYMRWIAEEIEDAVGD
ncbi:hypothetical protein [Mesobacillus zeae]|uniref:hypothetical protein n=1 Tax=Mesobacillus zeae TaxID=1917180 RepID=UPI00300A9776